MTEQALESVQKLSRDIRNISSSISVNEARYLVDAYYSIQEYRKASSNQVRALGESKEPHEVIHWLADQMQVLEGQIQKSLDIWSNASALGRWARSICGIGPVISAGLLAHIDITKAPTVGHIWSFAGYNPDSVWEKGQKRPFNASLKVLCWKIGESFVKTSSNKNDVYGKLWIARKEYEQTKNDAMELADQAKAKLERFKISKSTDAYKSYSQGKLPPAHIHARAKRWAVKLFLAHYHHVAYYLHYNAPPPKPYVLEHGMGHVHFIAPPNFDPATMSRNSAIDSK